MGRRKGFRQGLSGVGLLVGVFLSLGAWLAGPVWAVEFGTIRLGDDYSFEKVPEGAGYRWCERSCENDPRCRAWTFIRPNRQCRLKHSVAPAFRNECCVSGVKRVAEDRGKQAICARYARRAIEQYDENLARECRIRGDAWHDDYKRHYRQCLRMGPKARQRMTRQRDAALRRCAQNRKRINRICDRYARTAMAQTREARANDCGFDKAPRWQASYEGYYDWCLNAREADRKRENKARETALAACVARGGGPYVKACDDYATAAVRQFQRAQKNACGFTGPLWRKDFAYHYQQCLRMDAWERKTKRQARRKAIQRCVAQIGESGESRMACDHYARIAAEQTRSNRKNNCGLKGQRWLAGYDRHYGWCLRASKAERDNDLAYREAELAKCFARGGGPFNPECDAYAKTAVALYRKSVAKNCGFSGVDWHDRYIDHYKGCLKASPRSRRHANRRRAMDIKGCQFLRKLPFRF